MIGDVANRIDSLLCSSCCDENLSPLQILVEGQIEQYLLVDDLRLGQLADALVSTCELAAGGLQHPDSNLEQPHQVVLSDRVEVHVGVHRRNYQLRAGGGQKCRSQHIVSYAIRSLSDEVCSCRSDDEIVSGFCNGDVCDIKLEIPVKCICHAFVARKCLEYQRRDELGSVPGHDYVNIGMILLERAHQRSSLVCGDSAGNTNDYAFILKHGSTSSCLHLVVKLYNILSCAISQSEKG